MRSSGSPDSSLRDWKRRTIVASFSDHALRAYRALAPAAATSASPSEVLTFWTAVQEGRAPSGPLGYEALQVPPTYQDVVVVNEPFLRVAHECGLVVHVWTIDDEATMAALLDLGVDGVVTNRPSMLGRVRAERFPPALN